MEAIDYNKLQFDSVGRCIYCGAAEDLRKEHILPFGLSGTAVLHKASCGVCAGITSKVEERVLRGAMWPLRVYLDLTSRTKHEDAPKTHPIRLVVDGEEKPFDVPAEEYPIIVPFPLFAPPAYIAPNGYTEGIRTIGRSDIRFGGSVKGTLKNYGASAMNFDVSVDVKAFARMIAKIGYAMAVANGEIERISGAPFPLASILGKDNEIGRWVGTTTYQIPATESWLERIWSSLRKCCQRLCRLSRGKEHEGTRHRLDILRDEERGLLVAEVQLFSNSPTPSYAVLLGKLNTGEPSETSAP